MDFPSIRSFVGFLAVMEAKSHEHREALEKAAVVVETEAKRAIGTHDYGWPPLAASTVEKKGHDSPLLDTGELRDSITHTVSDNEARIGSNLDKAVWHEYGTRHIPPRPFLSSAAMHKEPEIVKIIGEHGRRLIGN
jgi:HK97 gp10 family phage protein